MTDTNDGDIGIDHLTTDTRDEPNAPVVSVHELDDDPDTCYLFAVPKDTEFATIESVADMIEDNLEWAQVVLIAGDVDSDLMISELDQETLDEVTPEPGDLDADDLADGP